MKRRKMRSEPLNGRCKHGARSTAFTRCKGSRAWKKPQEYVDSQSAYPIVATKMSTFLGGETECTAKNLLIILCTSTHINSFLEPSEPIIKSIVIREPRIVILIEPPEGSYLPTKACSVGADAVEELHCCDVTFMSDGARDLPLGTSYYACRGDDQSRLVSAHNSINSFWSWIDQLSKTRSFNSNVLILQACISLSQSKCNIARWFGTAS